MDMPPAGRAPADTGSVEAGHDPDLELVLRIGRGDRLACTQFVDRYLDRVQRLATRLTGNREDAEEAAQEVFIRVWQQAARWTPGNARFSTWLYRVTTNVCYDRLRRRREHEPMEAADHVSGGDSPERIADAAEREARVAAALEALPERQHAAIALCHYEGLSQREAAAALEVSEEALESLLARGRRALRRSLIGDAS
ncbi:RNA polymerase sigma factor [Coralloluteibacterium stylophorae]|uniref:RNA polymerase sigma factor n=3 Tax=Coralloluteibacterium stylophorae TaxID=1776034 RepID=A0A8J7VYA8_9GAMM|nr:RNA polymerase sigma factor [Coralloluteibacterium stylophorae]MBS7458021.1 RNA polymerase sigma factor [Coralloluteibacterium stylophorae]